MVSVGMYVADEREREREKKKKGGTDEEIGQGSRR